MDAFGISWSSLRAAVAELTGDDFERPSGCAGWLVRDLLYHLIIGAQDVLITLVTPSGAAISSDAVDYWRSAGAAPPGETTAPDEPGDELIIRLAAAYGDPRLLRFHFDDVGAAAGRAADLADRAMRVSTQEQVLTAGDFLDAYVLEWTLHHLDLVAYLPRLAGPPDAGLARSRQLIDDIAGSPLPPEISDRDALLIATGRRAPETDALGGLSARLPLRLG